MITPTSPEGNNAYRNGLCVDCRSARYGAGRTRCNDCHAVWQQPLTVAPVKQPETFLQRIARRKGITVDMDAAS